MPAGISSVARPFLGTCSSRRDAPIHPAPTLGSILGIIRTFSVVFILNVIDYFLAPITTILVAKNLTVAEYGLFSWIGTLIGFVTTFFTLGLGQYNYRTIPGRSLDEQYRVFGRSLFIELAFSLVGALGVVVWMHDDLLKAGLLAFFFLRLLFVVLNNELMRFAGFQKKNILKSVTAVIDSRAWFLPLVVFYLLRRITVPTVFVSMLVGNLISLVVLLAVSDRRRLVANLRPDVSFAKEALKISLPLVLVDMGMYLQEMAGRYILKIYGSYEAIGLFAFAYSWFALIFKFGMLFIYTLQPYFSETYHHWQAGDDGALAKFNNQLKVGFRYSLVLLGGVLVFFIMNYEDVIVLVGKAQYKATIAAAWCLVPYPVFMFLSYFNQILMVLKGRTRVLPLFYALAAIFNIGLNFLLVPSYGYAAAALVSTLSYGILAALLSTQTRDKEFRFRMNRREVLELVGFFAILVAANYLGNFFIPGFWLRMAAVLPIGGLSLLLVIKRRDLAIAKSF